MVDTITSFTPGDLVVSIYGQGNGSTTYYDNQGSPITLEELTTSGTVVGQIVLPQTTNVNAAGTTEYAISGEYGSSSEGTLELSTDGHSLVIAGYGLNATTYNNAEAGYQPTDTGTASTKASGGTYGNGALAQTYSVPTNGPNGTPAGDTTVARVIADINANGTVDTSTALYNVDNENNPRSVATTNGSSFYLSGQGVKGDTTQGVFLASDGENDPSSTNTLTKTAIYNGVDTRTTVIYNNVLYVSEDSSASKGKGGIYSFGSSPNGATTPTALPGMTGQVTLSANQGNTVNNSSGAVDLSPENFFFANSTTLYVADSGIPKGGTAGDGGLQKWTFSNNTWNLDYTLSAGLNLVSNGSAPASPTGYGTDATTGLIGLTGQVNGNSVSLFATNATLGDLNNTYVFGITDSLSATAATTSQSESFTKLFAAPADSNVRGIAFAPTVCFASGTRIRTARGDVSVEHLRVGDRAVTASGKLRPIRWLGHRAMDCARHPQPETVMPVRIAAGAVAPGVPARDLLLSPAHCLCLDLLGEKLVPAHRLCNGATIRQEAIDTITYWHVELDSHDILLAENTPAESYLECGNRTFFAEAENAVTLHGVPDAPAHTMADACRPFHDDGALVAAAQAQLAHRAVALGWVLADRDLAGVHLVAADGRMLAPVLDDHLLSFAIPAGAGDLRLRSAASRPCDVGLGADRRTLGLCVTGLNVATATGTTTVPLDDARLGRGFYPVEDGTHRWSDGDALLPATLWNGSGCILHVRLAAASLRCWEAPKDPASESLAA